MNQARLTDAGFTGIGSMPGDDVIGTIANVFNDSPDLPWLPELPARGPGSDMIGRTLAMISDAVDDIGFDLQPSGWRLTRNKGLEAARAIDRLDEDADALLAFADFDGIFKTQIAGPWTLAATTELTRGGRALHDRGARRDLTEALGEAANKHRDELAKRLTRATFVIQVDEPSLPSVIEGRIPTESGFGRIAAIERVEATSQLRTLIDATEAPVVIHCCAPHDLFDVMADAGAGAISWDAAQLIAGERVDEDAIGGLVERGVQLWLGVVPGLGPGVAPTVRSIADPIRRFWRSLGFASDDLPAAIVLTPACGLAGASIGWSRESMRVLRQASRALSEAPEMLRS